MAAHRDDEQGSAVAAGAAAAFEALLGSLRDALRGQRGPESSEAETAIPPTVEHLIRRGEKLCADLAAYAGKQRLVPADVELLPLLISMAHLLRNTLDARIEVSLSVDPACTVCRVDAVALEEALMQLVVNARDAMPDGGRLNLDAAPVQIADATPGIAISVEDSGIGMPADLATQAARPFYTAKAGQPGAGLGLAAVEGFARQSGGYLALRSSPGKGTKATLFLRC